MGGMKPRIGAIGIGKPQPSLKDSNTISTSSSVFAFLGHKEDGIAKEMSENLAKRLNKNVVAAGMHLKGLQHERVKEVIEACQRLKLKILKVMKEL